MNNNKYKEFEETLTNYFPLWEIQRSSHSIVYKMYEKNTNKFHAIKLIRLEKGIFPEFNELLKEEINNLITLSMNKNVIKLKGIAKEYKQTFLIFEYCNGGSLKDYCKRLRRYGYQSHDISMSTIQKIFKQLIEGLKYVHDNNIIHRDLKMDNILINYNDIENLYIEGKPLIEGSLWYNLDRHNFTIKIIDFGLSKKADENKNVSGLVGNSITLAPELASIRMRYDKYDTLYNSSADIWSVGVILYELLFGKVPFSGNEDEQINKIYEGIYEIPLYVYIGVEAMDLLIKLLQYDSKNRLNCDQILNHPFLTKNPNKFDYFILFNNEEEQRENDKVRLKDNGKIRVKDKDKDKFKFKGKHKVDYKHVNIKNIKVNSKNNINDLTNLLKKNGINLPQESDEDKKIEEGIFIN
jgi:serine/threonine protein kinase